MDATKRRHFYFLTAALAICGFIYLDVYVIPSKKTVEVITNQYAWATHARGFLNYYIITTRGKYQLPYGLYEDLNNGDTIIVGRSILTNAIQTLTYRINGNVQRQIINVMHMGRFTWYMLALVAGIIVFMTFYNSMKYLPGRANLSVFLFIWSLVFLTIYVLLNVYYVEILF